MQGEPVFHSAPASFSSRRLAAAVLAAGTLLGVAALPASAADHARPHRQEVQITQVKYDAAPGRDDRNNRTLNREWVEISNRGRHGVNLSGWTLSDRDGHTYTFRHYRLDGRSSVRVHTGRGFDTRHDLFQDRSREVWDNHDTATLRNDRGHRVDSESWGLGRGRHH
ncbi:lamin tail domain-containing protein [Streptomyces griseoaurantiacus]|uniref:lamin tail domain-containing protein n=1 Tax=Streptomyces griseoaurantiacus TaxID=68213 RepID=UPI000592D8EB|nr:lamin tail domain-containing protein [Streptomyces griseoaurantiacus]